MNIQPISPIEQLKNSRDKHYGLDGSSIYNKATGDTEKEITELSFEEILRVVRKDENSI